MNNLFKKHSLLKNKIKRERLFHKINTLTNNKIILYKKVFIINWAGGNVKTNSICLTTFVKEMDARTRVTWKLTSLH